MQQLNSNDPSVIDIATQVALADCNLYLAQERLTRLYPASSPYLDHAYIIQTLSNSREAQDSLINQLRVKMVLESFGMMRTLTTLVQATIPDYEPKDQLKALSIFTQLFQTLVTGQNNNLTINNNLGGFNVYDKLLAVLPFEVREAVKQLTPDNTEDILSEGADRPVQIITRRQKKRQQLEERDDEIV